MDNQEYYKTMLNTLPAEEEIWFRNMKIRVEPQIGCNGCLFYRKHDNGQCYCDRDEIEEQWMADDETDICDSLGHCNHVDRLDRTDVIFKVIRKLE